MNPWVTIQKERIFSFFEKNIEQLTGGRALKTMIVPSAARLKSLFVHANFPKTHFVRTTNISNKFIKAIVVPSIEGLCARHRNCSQLFHTYLQRNIGSCRGGELGDG